MKAGDIMENAISCQLTSSRLFQRYIRQVEPRVDLTRELECDAALFKTPSWTRGHLSILWLNVALGIALAYDLPPAALPVSEDSIRRGIRFVPVRSIALQTKGMSDDEVLGRLLAGLAWLLRV